MFDRASAWRGVAEKFGVYRRRVVGRPVLGGVVDISGSATVVLDGFGKSSSSSEKFWS